jgi:hypothetical protein
MSTTGADEPVPERECSDGGRLEQESCVETEEFVMKTLTITIVLASMIATPAVAKTDRTRTPGVESNQSANELSTSAYCGRSVLTDPDPRIRAVFLRDCAYHE